LARAGEPAVRYAIYVPPNYSPTPVPLILALHFGVGGGDASGAGGDVLQILVGPALAELGAIIIAPDSLKGDWSTPENEKAVTALLDMVEASLKHMGEQIFSGVATVHPFRKGKMTACSYCEYRPICRFDPWTQSYRVLTHSNSASASSASASASSSKSLSQASR
jgi:hypothetical protein